MAETIYSFSISTDFPGAKVNTEKLDTEIRANSGITKSLNCINTFGDTIDIVFNAALSAEEETILHGDVTTPAGGMISSHDNSPSLSVSKTNTVRNVGGEAVRVCSCNMELDGTNTNKSHQYDLLAGEKFQIQGVVIIWDNCFYGDYAQMSVILTNANTNPNAQHLSGESVITLNNTGFGAFYNPANSIHMRMEIYEDTGVFLESIKISSVSGDAVTLASPISQNIESNYILKASLESYTHEDTGFHLMGAGNWSFVQENEVSVPLENISLEARLFVGAGTGKRTFIANFIGRKYD